MLHGSHLIAQGNTKISSSIQSGAYPGGCFGDPGPVVTKGAPKRKGKKERKRNKREKEERKEGAKKGKDR